MDAVFSDIIYELKFLYFVCGFNCALTWVNFFGFLFFSGREGFLLTPISFITTNSIRMVNEQCGTNDATMQSVSDRRVTFNDATSGFISELTQDPGCSTMQLRCKVYSCK